MLRLSRIAAAAALLVSATVRAQETVDIGVIRDSDVHVVQNVLYPMTGRLELGAHLGWMPFDVYTTTPNAQLSLDYHLDELLAVSVVAGGGYGLKTGRYKELESPAIGVAPYAYRYLASALVGVSVSPIYAKMNVGGRIIHYDIYGSARLGATIESSIIQGGGVAAAPTLALGIGSRFHVSRNGIIRFELRDDMLIERRRLTATTHFKQNLGVSLGFTVLLGNGEDT